MEIDRSRLLFGEDVPISGNIFVKNPTIGELRKLGFAKYARYMTLLCLEPVDVADILYVDNGIWYKDITAYSLFLTGCSIDTIYIEALNWFTQREFAYVADEQSYLYYTDENDKIIILNEVIFAELTYAIKSINYVGKRDGTNYETKASEIDYLKKKRKQRKYKEPATIDILSIISSLSWKVGIRMNDLLTYNISQIYDGYYRLNSIDTYDKTLYGVYSGNVDSSKIDMEKLNWSRILTI